MKSIDVNMFVSMLNGGYLLVERNLAYINELNVFPVPDGDTGTNLKITIYGGIDRLRADNIVTKNFSEIGRTFSRALLLSARGNSGVIFSQIMDGFTRLFTNEMKEVDVPTLIQCFKLAKETAYSAVVKPVEGTILTVIRMVADSLAATNVENVEELFANAVKIANETVNKTPEMLKDLKIAGVVDSGGFGLARFLEGMYAVVANKKELLTSTIDNDLVTTKLIRNSLATEEHSIHDVSDFGYCTEFLINLSLSNNTNGEAKKPFVKSKFVKNVRKNTNSVNVIYDEKEKLVRVHGHTVRPDLLLAEGLTYGEFINVKIENMNLQVSERRKKGEAEKISFQVDNAIILAIPSPNLLQFATENYGITNFINVKNTGNPSVSDFIKSFYAAKAKNIILVLYDSNTLMSAENAKSEVKKVGISVEIICEQNFIEALAACSAFNPSLSIHSNVKAMMKSADSVVSTVISRSTKTIKYPKLLVRKDDYISFVGKSVKFAHKSRLEVVKLTVDSLIQRMKKPELLIIIHGQDVDLKETKQLEDYFNQKYGLYCEIVNGNQDVYSYFIGIQ